MRLSIRTLFLASLLGGLCLSLGCQPEIDPSLMLLDTKLSETRVNDLKRSMDFIRSERQYEIQEFEEKVNAGLNRWASNNVGTDVEWKLDPVVADLVEEMSVHPFAQGIDKVSFVNTDATYLQNCAWSKVIADRMIASRSMDGFEMYRMAAEYQVDKKSDEDQLDKVLAKLHPNLSQDDTEKLANTVRIFDWIARNIQLLPAKNLNSDEAREAQLYEADRPSLSGVPGIGYVRFPAQVLVYARGDYAEKSKVFINMLQQAGLDSVMLSVDDKDADGNAVQQPWCVAVNIDDQLFLFDMKLGMPIPNHETKGIATLSEVQANPELLTWLDLTVDESLADDTKYWVQPAQLESLRGNILVSPESVSRRMAKLEQSLVDNDEPELTVNPTELIEEFKKLGLEMGVWEVAFDTHLFRQALRKALNESVNNNRLQDKTSWYYTDEAYIDGFNVYRTARSVFLNGHFDSDRNAMRGNAIERFFALMYTDDTIRNLGTNAKLQRRHHILKDTNQSPSEYQRLLKGVQGQMMLIARDTSYFLAQCHFDNGNLGVASIWLDRIKDKANAERWADGIFYLLGRSLEGNREYDRALKAYRQQDDSAQMHGNRIRARLIESLIPKTDTAKP